MSHAEKKTHEKVLEILSQFRKELESEGIKLELPPKVLSTLNTQYTSFEEGKSLVAEFHFDPRYANPVGIFQGGMLAAVLDNVYGPLAYMTMKRSVLTVEMSLRYHSPFTPEDKTIRVSTAVLHKSKSVLTLEGKIHSPGERLIVSSQATLMVVSPKKP